MTANVGTTDRVIRAVLGLVLLVLPFVNVWSGFENVYLTYSSVIVGIILLATAIAGTCPLYSVLGLSTNGRT